MGGLDEEQKQFLLFAIGGVIAFIVVWFFLRTKPAASSTSTDTTGTPQYIPTSDTTLNIDSYNTTPSPGTTPTPTPTPTSSGQLPGWEWATKYLSGLQRGSDPGGYYTVTKAMSLNELAKDFGLPNGWTDIAYNAPNSGLLKQAYATKGNVQLQPGTRVFIPTPRIRTHAAPNDPNLTPLSSATGGSGFESMVGIGVDNMQLAPLPWGY